MRYFFVSFLFVLLIGRWISLLNGIQDRSVDANKAAQPSIAVASVPEGSGTTELESRHWL
jgi:hypothetical protein